GAYEQGQAAGGAASWLSRGELRPPSLRESAPLLSGVGKRMVGTIRLPHGLIIALQFLTRLPTPRLASEEPLARGALYVPLVGLLLGALLALAVWTGSQIGPWIGALAGLILWIWATGGIHLDGLGDVADALAAAHKRPERFREVLADPHAGSFAVIA